jgi:polyribonucleotide nucleotidyltransferase
LLLKFIHLSLFSVKEDRRSFPFQNLKLLVVIGKGGVKINEIRSQSQCQIRVTEPGTPAQPGASVNPDERLVTITGQPANINIAVQMLYSVSPLCIHDGR